MSSLKNDRLLRTIWREPVTETPIWIMRQAGRYLPEYRAVRAKAGSFMTLCQTPELACEVTIQPLDRFDLDAAIIFSDILTIPDAMGLGLQFIEGEGPIFSHSLKEAKDIERLQLPRLEQLDYVYQAIKLVKKELNGKVPLIGFCGSPWTLAAYMIEGRSQPGFPLIQVMRQTNPQLLHQLLDKLALSVSKHLNGQIEAGADVAMIFDTWGGLLDRENYSSFSLHYVKKAIQGIKQHNNKKKIPVILFTKGGGQFLDIMADSGCDVLGLDWETSLADARAKVGDRVILQGNLNPAHLRYSSDAIRQEVAAILASFGKGSGHIFNLGHGITPDISPERVADLVDAVHELSRDYHQ